MSEKLIEIHIDPEGNATIEAHGYSGSGCSLATRDYEKRLGKVVDDEKKPEYFEAEKEREIG